MSHTDETIVTDELALHYHLMHPGGDSQPGDPNVAFFLSIGRINTVTATLNYPQPAENRQWRRHYILGSPTTSDELYFRRFRSNVRNAFFTDSPFTWAYCSVVRRDLCPIRSRKINASISPARSEPKLWRK